MAYSVKYNICLFYLSLFLFPQFLQTFQSNHVQFWGCPKTNPHPSSQGADAICCMRGFKPSPATIDLRVVFLLVQVKGQGEMSYGWWELPPCASCHLHRVRWGCIRWNSISASPEQRLLANFSSLVCRLFSNCIGREKCIGVLEADTVLWPSLCWPSHYLTRWNRCVCWLQSIGI